MRVRVRVRVRVGVRVRVRANTMTHCSYHARRWVEWRAAAQRLGAKAATWRRRRRLGCAVSGWGAERSARREWRVGLLMAR